MNLDFTFFFNSILLGVGLAMDAFSVSLANGMNNPTLKKGKAGIIAGIFAIFQAMMPMIGWTCVYFVAREFGIFETFIPYIALVLLSFIGGKMIYESVKKKKDESEEKKELKFGAIIVQGVATSIDALSVGFTISDYNWAEALLACGIIGVLTFFICFAGIFIGKKLGTKLADKAGIFGGVILIIIGLEIFITSFF